MRRALLSVSDKTGLVALARRLAALGIELLSTGGTARHLREAGLSIIDVSEVTGFPEILGGRVKSLHPAIHGGILARRNHEQDRQELADHDITPIDLLVVNLYPFEEATSSDDAGDEVAVENIDIGGPTMIRAAAKNWFFVSVVTSISQYDEVADELEKGGGSIGLETRRRLAYEAFDLTSRYDRAIASYLHSGADTISLESSLPHRYAADLPVAQVLRYGENPHQHAVLYGDPGSAIEPLHGKELSFNNLLDTTAALALLAEFADAPPTVAILKHTNPCGVGTASTLVGAYSKAFATDRQSPFGGIVAVNRPLDLETAEAIDEVFTEIIIAPGFEDAALAFLTQKRNRRLIRAGGTVPGDLDVRSSAGGLLVQEMDPPLGKWEELRASCTVATRRQPTEQEWADLDFAWRVCKHVKSNAIVYAGDGATLGIGAGQMSRIDSSEIAVAKAAKSGLDLGGSVVASDAFFPFADGLVAAAAAGARAVIQPGGSVRDEEVIAAANERDMAMVFTHQRHFRH